MLFPANQSDLDTSDQPIIPVYPILSVKQRAAIDFRDALYRIGQLYPYQEVQIPNFKEPGDRQLIVIFDFSKNPYRLMQLEEGQDPTKNDESDSDGTDLLQGPPPAAPESNEEAGITQEEAWTELFPEDQEVLDPNIDLG